MRPPTNSIPSIISSDVIIKGNVSTAGEIQIDGTIEGDVKSKNLTVGENGSVNGKVNADDVVVKGTVKGSITGRSVRLEKTAKLTGDICHQTLSIEAGAYIEGNLSHQSAQPAASNAQKVMSANKEPKKEEPKEDKKDLVDLI
ncbi:bactofilin family protein [Pseudemcibacter aquimaris]|uniref:bactofilin family protein n=1 Tax=Pseudemcibacter aquimaris TaxID=2857064 RepID=UPI0020136AD0|nr:polymer-forming cytoskeletal protein [Pseudemcibacter aquimaris]MCC3860909.1 polymer-forming cytoskeletal protein [Pseudemcibacter aquimaris]WDU59728.1 polymer-forming cytoskeletal protein [Pseudemcibacter aquimaris]